MSTDSSDDEGDTSGQRVRRSVRCEPEVLAVKICDCLTYVRLNLEVLARNRGIMLLTALLALVFCIPVFLSVPTGADYLYGRGSIEEQRALLASQVSGGVYDTAPQELNSIIADERACLDRALENKADSRGYYDAIADYDNLLLKEYRLGYLNGVDSELSLEAQERLPRAISMLSHPESYGSTTKMPGTFLLAYYCGVVPAIVWLLVPVLVLFISLEGDGKRFYDRALLSKLEVNACRVLVAGIASMVVLVLALAPCFVLATAFNGAGQAEYPVVFIQYGDVVERTVLVQLGQFAVFETALSMMFACLGVCVYAGSGNRAISSMAVALVGGISQFPFYASKDAPWHALLPYMVSSYSVSSLALGGVSYANGAEASLVPEANSSYCFFAIAGTLFVCAVGIISFSRLKSRRRWGWNHILPDSSGEKSLLSLSLDTLTVGKKRLVKGLQFDMPAGQIWGLVAPNGYGKTTLLNALWGDTGSSARVLGSLRFHSKACIDSEQMRKVFFLVPNGPSLLIPHTTVAFHLDRCRRIWHSPRSLDQVLNRFDLTGLKNTSVSRLSDGNRQLLNIAMAYMSYCEVVLLDEPMNALDVRHAAIVSDALRDEADRGAHVIICSHLIGNLESLCDAAVLLTRNDPCVVAREMGGDSKWIGSVYAQLFKTNDSKN